MDRTKLTNDYMASYNELVEKFKEKKIVTLVEQINAAIGQSDINAINNTNEKISDWNNQVSNLQGVRDALLTYDKRLRLPAVVEFLIVFDHVIKEWRFNTEAL